LSLDDFRREGLAVEDVHGRWRLTPEAAHTFAFVRELQPRGPEDD
jgi:hypothetical protein